MNKDELIKELRQSDLPTVIDFWAPWCAPCRLTKPILEELSKSYAGKVVFRVINADEHPTLLKELKIYGIPTLLIMDTDKNMRTITGVQSPQNYRRLFEALAIGEELAAGSISNADRLLRLGAGAALAFIAWINTAWWLLPIGLLVMFLGIYDRCPIWQAISARLKRSN